MFARPLLRPLVLALVLASTLLVDLAPALAQDGTIQLAQAQRRRTLFDLLFGEEQQPAAAPPPVEVAPRQEPRRQTAPAAAPQASAPPPEPAVEKAENATRLAVFGDSLAVDVAKALDRFYAEDTNLVVLDEAEGSSGFVRDDYYDWDAAITAAIAENSFDLAVVIIGINDRQELTVNGQTLAPLSDGWRAAYQARIAGVLNKLRQARKPVIWVGLPPMSKTEYSAAMSQISAVQKLAAFSGGAEFLDIYDRFLGEDGKYSSSGPDVNGQNARMRKDDGIHFSAAGADKVAFFLNQSLRTFYRGGTVAVAVADPLAGTAAEAMARPPYQGLGQMRLLEVAGAIVPLGRVPPRAGDLLSAATLAEPTAPFALEDLMQAPAGRVDAFDVGIDPNAVPVENPGGR